MINYKVWIVLSVLAAIVAIPLYRAIDSEWSRENNGSIWITIAFFIAAAFAIIFAFNAASSHKSPGHK
jgi:hypothetical protein